VIKIYSIFKKSLATVDFNGNFYVVLVINIAYRDESELLKLYCLIEKWKSDIKALKPGTKVENLKWMFSLLVHKVGLDKH
jgi:hypothetical protein